LPPSLALSAADLARTVPLGQAARPPLGRPVPRAGGRSILTTRSRPGAGAGGAQGATGGRAALRSRPRLRPGARMAPGACGAARGAKARPARARHLPRAETTAEAPDTLFLMARRALVTGGAGFIGSHLSELLLA